MPLGDKYERRSLPGHPVLFSTDMVSSCGRSPFGTGSTVIDTLSHFCRSLSNTAPQ